MFRRGISLSKIVSLIKKEAVLFIAALFALFSMFLVPLGVQYFSYIDYPVLGILFCLMLVVAGLRKLGVFDFLSLKLLTRAKSVKHLYILLINCVFVFSMFVTNDVALIVFVPLTIGIFDFIGHKKLIFTIVMETLAANLGSMLTPIGNPQNLYIYSFYNLDIPAFFGYVLPVGLVSYVVIMAILLLSRNENRGVKFENKFKMGTIKLDNVKKLLLYYAGLFILCIVTVLRVLDYRICVLVVLAATLIVDRELLKKVDYGLLLTFTCFFIFVGNLGRIDAVKDTLSLFLEGRVFIVSILSSQIISNVPAAMMISDFTRDVRNLLLGVNIGGLGTPVASLASLISFRFYSRSKNSASGKFLAVFSVYNIAILLLLSVIFYFAVF